MQLNTGSRVGPYEITGTLGAGGMGEVYRALDTRLNREVAIKILPDLFAVDRDRVLRFDREAQTLAALNHPNIAHVHGVIETPLALVMELVEGEDLSARISSGALSFDEAIPIARQIAEALEAAHERGIVHRDLKPANVKVRADGVVKVLDFGLAKAMDSPGSGSAIANSPTVITAATQLGTILGTAAYMSPEQARGKAVDKRSDIWAFGCVLFEMLTGRRPFEGETITDILGAIVHKAPDFSLLPARTPPSVRNLIARCLEKDATRRLRDIGEARVALSEGSIEARPDETPSIVQRKGATLLPWLTAAAMTIAALAFAALWIRTPPPERAAPLRASIEPPPDRSFTGSLALSPDGTRLAFSARGRDDQHDLLWVQDLATSVASAIRHTEDGSRPFWSPDGKQIGFFAEGKLKRIDLIGSPAQIVADAPTPRGGAWTPDGRIIFVPTFRGGLEIISVNGGQPTALTKPAGSETSHRWPVVLPDGRHIIFLAQTGEGGNRSDTSSIDVVAIDGSDRRKLISANSSPIYVEPGFVLFWRDRALLAQRVDSRTTTPTGEPFAIAQDVAYDQNEAVLATASASGRLIFQPGGTLGEATLTWVERSGRVAAPVTDTISGACGWALSPDAARFVVAKTPAGANGCELWMHDLQRGVQTRLTFDETNGYVPVFSHDGRSIFFGSDKGKNAIYKLDLDGRGTPQAVVEDLEGFTPDVPGSISRAGTWMIFSAIGAKSAEDVVRYDFTAKTLKPIVTTPFSDTTPVLSPDERWIAYASDRSGRYEIYVESVNGDGNVWAVSASGGDFPQWRSDGRELFYHGPPDRMMAAEVVPGSTFRTSAPKELFRIPFAAFPFFVVDSPGKRFIVAISKDYNVRQPMTVVSDWRPR